MAEILRSDTIDFRAHMRSTEARVKVHPAHAFAEDLDAEFAPRNAGKRPPHMLSTKLGKGLEFKPGELTVWAGYSGHKKSMFVGQVVLDLCVQRERSLIASFEMRPSRTLARMVRQASGISEPSARMRGEFLRWTNGRLWLFDHMGRISGDEMGAVCSYFANELDGQHIVIDSMMMVCKSEEHIDEQKQFLTDLCRITKETGVHIHLVAHCRKGGAEGETRPPTKQDVRGSAAIVDQADNVITVWANKPKAAGLEKDGTDEKFLSQPDALISVEKQRNGKFEGKYSLWFDEASMRFMNDRTSAVEPYVLEDLL